MLQGHLVGSLLPIPEVEGKEGSRYPRHRWTDSVMCSYFQIRRRKDSADGRGILKPKKERRKERKKTDNPREGWEDGTPPPHRDFKERGVVH